MGEARDSELVGMFGAALPAEPVQMARRFGIEDCGIYRLAQHPPAARTGEELPDGATPSVPSKMNGRFLLSNPAIRPAATAALQSSAETLLPRTPSHKPL